MRIAGIVILVLGIVFLVFGLNSTQVLPEKAVESLTGRYTSETMLYLIGGVVMIVAGASMVGCGCFRKKP